MSSRRSRSRQASSPTVTDAQIIDDLVMKLRAVLPRSRIAGADRVSAATVLQETCDYIRSLQQEVGDLSKRLSESLAAGESGAAAAAADEAARIVRSLLMM